MTDSIIVRYRAAGRILIAPAGTDNAAVVFSDGRNLPVPLRGGIVRLSGAILLSIMRAPISGNVAPPAVIVYDGVISIRLIVTEGFGDGD